jgi:hypothetical protein
MNNKNFNNLYGGNFNNLKDMLVEDVSDTSDYNVSLLNQFQENQTNKTGSGLANLLALANPTNIQKFANQASAAMNMAEKLVKKADTVINKTTQLANQSGLIDNKVNDCITIAQSMEPDQLERMIKQLQDILVKKSKK